MIIWITGRPNVGKTTTGKLICFKNSNCILLDGDELRKSLKFTGFKKEDRYNWIDSIGNLAKIIESQGYIPVVALVSPYKEKRKEVLSKFKLSILIYISGGEENMWEGSDYEEPNYTESTLFCKLRGYNGL